MYGEVSVREGSAGALAQVCCSADTQYGGLQGWLLGRLKVEAVGHIHSGLWVILSPQPFIYR